MGHVVQTNNYIDLEKVRFLMKEASWTICGITEAISTRKTGVHTVTVNRDFKKFIPNF